MIYIKKIFEKKRGKKDELYLVGCSSFSARNFMARMHKIKSDSVNDMDCKDFFAFKHILKPLLYVFG